MNIWLAVLFRPLKNVFRASGEPPAGWLLRSVGSSLVLFSSRSAAVAAAVRDGQLCDVAPCCTVAEAQLSYSCSFFVVVVRLGEEFSFPNKVDHIIETIFNIYY